MDAGFRLLSCVVVAGAVATPFLGVGRLAASGAAPPGRAVSADAAALGRTWDTFVADVAISRGQVTAAGVPSEDGPQSARFHWERARSGSGWKTTFTLLEKDGPTVDTPRGSTAVESRATAVGRLEFDGAGGPMRLFDRYGRELKLPSAREVQQALHIGLEDNPVYRRLSAAHRPSVSTRAAGADWIDNFVLRADRREQRRAALAREFGDSPRRYQGKDRFVRADGGVVHEVLTDPSSSIPVEMNLVRDGTLTTHATFSYTEGQDGSFTRRAIHVENLLPGSAQDRRVTDIAFSSVRFENRGGR